MINVMCHIRGLLLILIYMPVWGQITLVEKDLNPKILHDGIVYQPGEGDYDFFRIPSLIRINDQLMAFAEGRKNSLSDHGQIDLVMKTSNDLGHSWSPMQVVVHYVNESCQNPTPIYIEGEDKLIVLFTKRTVASDTEAMIRSGTSKGDIAAYAVESTDGGKTWSSVKEITDQVKRPDWRWYAFGPGGAITINKDTDHKGRLIIPANHSTSEGVGNEYLGAHVVYSDDNGQSWHIGAVDSRGEGSINPNESNVVETSSGNLYFNTRNQHSGDQSLPNRAITWSKDGGESFIRQFFPEPQLITPVVHASLARSDSVIFFVAPNHPRDRKNLSIWISRDEGLSWNSPKTIFEGFSAYSSTIYIKPGRLGILAETGEKDPYERIMYFEVAAD